MGDTVLSGILHETGGLASVYTGTWARAIPLGTPQQRSPGTVGIQQRNVGSSSEGWGE